MNVTLKRVAAKHVNEGEVIKYDVIEDYQYYLGTVVKVAAPEEPGNPWRVPFGVYLKAGQWEYPTRKAAVAAVLSVYGEGA